MADAEVEYEDHTSNTIYVKFLIHTASDKDLEGANIVIWTTTPWTIPGNRALAFGSDLLVKSAVSITKKMNITPL